MYRLALESKLSRTQGSREFQLISNPSVAEVANLQDITTGQIDNNELADRTPKRAVKALRSNRSTLSSIIDALKSYQLSDDELRFLQKLFVDNVDVLDSEMYDQFPAMYEQVHATNDDFDEWYQSTTTVKENRLETNVSESEDEAKRQPK